MDKIKVIGNSGKHTTITIEELSKKRIIGKIEVKGNKYMIRLTRWYLMDEEFDNIGSVYNYLVNFLNKYDIKL